MTRWLFLLVALGTIVFTIGFIQDEEDRQGIGSSRLPRLRRWLPNHELHDLDNDNRDAGLRSESEPRRTPRQAPPPPPSNTPTPPPPVACSADQFQCLTGNQCIQRAYKCDSIPDCDDGSDEREQECFLQPCPLSNQFQCTSGDCIALDGRCDGKVDCMDKSDEVGCPSVEMQCSEDQFMCSDGSCIEKDWLCDLVTDCLDGDDEAQCCMTNEFTCGDGSCIPEYFRCDNKFDCTDGSDERNDCDQSE